MDLDRSYQVETNHTKPYRVSPMSFLGGPVMATSYCRESGRSIEREATPEEVAEFNRINRIPLTRQVN